MAKKTAVVKKKDPRVKPRKKASSPKKAAAAKKVKTVRKKTPREPSLGRPKVTGEEQLFMLFKEDYHARQIFDFLRVERVKELEEYSPPEIIKLLSRPIVETVDRIRRKLAEKNRSLRDDLEFAASQQQHE